jgi:hypothetical protein
MLIVQTMHSRSFGRKTINAYCSLWAGVVGFCSLFSLLTGDVVSAMKWRRLRKLPPSSRAFITSNPLYKWRIWFNSSPRSGRCCLALASLRHKIKAALWFKKFLEKNHLGKIRLGPPQTRDLRVCLRSATFFCNSPLFSTNLKVFLRTRGSWPQSRHWGVGGGMAWVAHLFPLSSQ